MTLFDLSDYNVRQLDPAQGTKPLDFGGGGITGSINLDGRFIAINTYHPEHGYITLTSIPPFPDEDRYDQEKVRAYRKSLVDNEGFGLQFEQEITKREYFLIEDAVPFIRFTLADGTLTECITVAGEKYVKQLWRSNQKTNASALGDVWLMRTSYSQLTEGGVLPMPSPKTRIVEADNSKCLLFSDSLERYAFINGFGNVETNKSGIRIEQVIEMDGTFDVVAGIATYKSEINKLDNVDLQNILSDFQNRIPSTTSLVLKRAYTYSGYCLLDTDDMNSSCLLTDHMILPLSWNRDSYYVLTILSQVSYWELKFENYLSWLIHDAWRGTYCKYFGQANNRAYARSYLANGMQKDSGAYQLDQQLFPMLALLDFGDLEDNGSYGQDIRRKDFLLHLKDMLHSLFKFSPNHIEFPTDETPADDEIPLNIHFSSHILLWYVYKRLAEVYPDPDDLEYPVAKNAQMIKEKIIKMFMTEHQGKQIFSYATGRTNGNKEHYIYHDANDIPLVMMPLWGFCDKDDEIWLNTIEFAFSDDNPGFYDGVLGSVHSPAPWALGDAQELIYCKVVGDRERYQRVWERLEKVAQWDGALPEAYNIDDYSVYSRHWFAWPNAMVAIADSIPWNWEEEGEYAR